MSAQIENSRRIVMLGDFNCGDVKWEFFEAGEGNAWGGRLLEVMMDNVMMQWISENKKIDRRG